MIKGKQSRAHYFLTVMPDLAMTTESIPVARPGQPFSFQLQFSNPEFGWPVVWDIVGGSLPLGLSLSESGLISGRRRLPGPRTEQRSLQPVEWHPSCGESSTAHSCAGSRSIVGQGCLREPLVGPGSSG